MDESLREQFLRVTMRFKRFEACSETSCPLPQTELAVLSKASSCCGQGDEGVCVSSIHENLYISKPAVSQTLNSLEQKGYIHRTIDPSDRRKITVTLTVEGQRALDCAKGRFDMELDSVLEQFGAESVKSLVGLIDRLMNIIENKE